MLSFLDNGFRYDLQRLVFLLEEPLNPFTSKPLPHWDPASANNSCMYPYTTKISRILFVWKSCTFGKTLKDQDWVYCFVTLYHKNTINFLLKSLFNTGNTKLINFYLMYSYIHLPWHFVGSVHTVMCTLCTCAVAFLNPAIVCESNSNGKANTNHVMMNLID